MKFSNGKTLPREILRRANAKLTTVLTELALSDNNHHPGSGMGGNAGQFRLLSRACHYLLPDVKDIVCIPDLNERFEFDWNVDFIVNESIKTIRLRLNELDPYGAWKDELNKAFITPNDLAALSGLVPNETELRRDVEFIWAGKNTKFSARSVTEQLYILALMCADIRSLAPEGTTTDGKIRDEITKRATKLGEFIIRERVEPEIILVSIRLGIGLDFMILNGLDEIPSFGKLLGIVNDTLP